MSRYGTRTYEVTIEGQTIRAIVEVYGRWFSASQDSPEEQPDCSITKAWRAEGEDGVEREVRPDELATAEIEKLIDIAIERDRESYFDPDRAR